MLGKPVLQFLAVESAQRHARQLNLEAAPMAKKPVNKDLSCVTQAEPIRRLVKGASENYSPEPPDRARRLSLSHSQSKSGGSSSGATRRNL